VLRVKNEEEWRGDSKKRKTKEVQVFDLWEKL